MIFGDFNFDILLTSISVCWTVSGSRKPETLTLIILLTLNAALPLGAPPVSAIAAVVPYSFGIK